MKRRNSKIVIIMFLLLLFSFPLCLRSQLVNDFRVNDDSTMTIQEQGAVDVDGSGNFVVVWNDFRYSTGDIYCQLFDNNGHRRGNNFKISSYTGHCISPDIAVRKDGSFGVCWRDTLTKFRLFNSNGIPISLEIYIDSLNNSIGSYSRISCDTLGNFLIVYEKYFSYSNVNIYFQRIDSLGNKIGNNTRINDDSTITCRHTNPVVTKRRDGSFIVAWQDTRPPAVQNGDDIYMQMFDKNGNKIGNNARVNNDTVMLDYQHLPKITSDDAGRFAIVFTEILDVSGSTYNLLQLYNPDGSPNGNNIRFSNNGSEQYPLISKRSNGDMVVCFRRDAVSQYVPYIQRILSNGSNLGSPFLVTDYYTTSGKVTSSICLFNDKIITVWNDNRFGNQDVFFNIRSFIKPDSVAAVRNISTLKPDRFSLHQNYPNPFNSVSKIKFEIAKLSDVNITVYDILGKEVSTLVNEELKPGTYETFFDGGGLSSGIYFCRLQVSGTKEFTSVKKMLMIK